MGNLFGNGRCIMTGEQYPSDNDDLTVADIIGDAFPSAMELADSLSEHELRNRLAELHEQRIDTQAKIAELQSQSRRLTSESLLTQEALRIASDKNLE